MNKILDSVEYKRMEDIVLRELQLKLLRSRLDDEIAAHYPDLSERTLAVEGVTGYFNHFIDKFPDWRGERVLRSLHGEKLLYRELRREDMNILDEGTKNFLKLQRKVKELIGETGLNRIKVKELVSNFYKSRNPEDYLSFIDYVFPVYVALRMEGYKHYSDLIV